MGRSVLKDWKDVWCEGLYKMNSKGTADLGKYLERKQGKAAWRDINRTNAHKLFARTNL